MTSNMQSKLLFEREQNDDRIRDVWLDNFLVELDQISNLLDIYNHVSMVRQNEILKYLKY
jgi:hypothetical protein